MKILFVSHPFHPAIGGLETVSLILATEFVAQGHEVCVITQTANHSNSTYPFKVIRRPRVLELLKLTHWCDVMFHNNISLQVAWPLLLIRRPWVVAHHTWLPSGHGVRGLKGLLKKYWLRWAQCISISKAIADHLRTPSVIIPNPYDDTLFQNLEYISRQNDLVFVGRLVSDKGVDLLLQSLSILRLRNDMHTTHLTIIGDGPEESFLRTRVNELELTSSVNFVGRMQDQSLVQELNKHSIMVVPSRWQEPFGVVALEGIACGCVVVGSAGGGLSDAIGLCGLTFANNDANALAECLYELLSNVNRVQELRAHANEHLDKHRKSNVASAYLKVIKTTVEQSSRDQLRN